PLPARGRGRSLGDRARVAERDEGALPRDGADTRPRARDRRLGGGDLELHDRVRWAKRRACARDRPRALRVPRRRRRRGAHVRATRHTLARESAALFAERAIPASAPNTPPRQRTRCYSWPWWARPSGVSRSSRTRATSSRRRATTRPRSTT